MRIPDLQRFVATERYLGVDIFVRGVRKEVDVAAALHFVYVGEGAIVIRTLLQQRHGRLDIDVADGQHASESPLHDPGLGLREEVRDTTGRAAFGPIKSHKSATRSALEVGGGRI